MIITEILIDKENGRNEITLGKKLNGGIVNVGEWIPFSTGNSEKLYNSPANRKYLMQLFRNKSLLKDKLRCQLQRWCRLFGMFSTLLKGKFLRCCRFLSEKHSNLWVEMKMPLVFVT